MTAKEYLSQIRRLDRLISNMQREIDNLRMSALGNQSPRLMVDKVNTSSGGGTMTDDLDNAIDIEREMFSLLREYRKTRWKIVTEINSLPDAKHSELLYLKYVEGKPLEDIACIMRRPNGKMYNYDYIKRLHGLALESFSKKFPNVT